MRSTRTIESLSEARAILEMILILIGDGYSIKIVPDTVYDYDGDSFDGFKVCVIDTDDIEVAASAAWCGLLDALGEAYQMTPE